MQRNEPYEKSPIKKKPLDNLKFQLAEEKHVEPVFELMAHRNPDMDREVLYQKVKKEITELSDGIKYAVFVGKRQL